MTIKKIAIRRVVVMIGLPLLLILIVLVFISQNKTNGSIVSFQEKMEYLLYVPKSYDRNAPTPLVISMHAAMNWPAYQMKISQWNKAADENGFIVVHPAGTDRLIRTQKVVHGRVAKPVYNAGCQIHLGVDRHPGGALQHRFDQDLREWYVQRRGNGLRFHVVHRIAAPSGVGGSITAVELVRGLHATGSDDRVSRDS